MAPTLGNLVVVQQEILGRTVDPAAVQVYPFCKRESVLTGTSSGAGDDWTCQLFVDGPHLGRLAAEYSVTVRPNGCYTAEGQAAVIGPLHLKTPDGGTADQPAVRVRRLHDPPVSLRQRVRARSVPATSVGHDPSSAHRRRVDRRWRVLRIVAVLLLIAAGVFSRVATGDVAAPAPVVQSSLGGLSCALPGRCVSVGTTGSRDTVLTPYAVWFADGTWTPGSPVPPLQNGDSILSAVSCASGTHCVAVGNQEVPAPYFGAKSAGGRPLIEVWTGQRMARPAIARAGRDHRRPAERGRLRVAVGLCGRREHRRKGGNDRALTQFWDGKAWTLVVPPRPRVMEEPTLYDVACTSATACTAVGHFTYDLGEFFSTLIAPLILRWNGVQWRFENSDSVGDSLDTELDAIACPVVAAVHRRGVAAAFRRHVLDVRRDARRRSLARAAHV